MLNLCSKCFLFVAQVFIFLLIATVWWFVVFIAPPIIIFNLAKKKYMKRLSEKTIWVCTCGEGNAWHEKTCTSCGESKPAKAA